MAFHGAKLALMAGDRLLVLLRDDIPTIPFPGMWDFPGGGREGQETPEETVLRELAEETGLILSPDALVWKRPYRRMGGTEAVWFFVAHVPQDWIGQEVLGDEGTALQWMPIEDYQAHPKSISGLVERLRHYLEDQAP